MQAPIARIKKKLVETWLSSLNYNEQLFLNCSIFDED